MTDTKLTGERVTLYRCPVCKVGQYDDYASLMDERDQLRRENEALTETGLRYATIGLPVTSSAARSPEQIEEEMLRLRRELEEAEAAICILTQQASDGTATYYDKPFGVYEDEHEGFNAIHRAHERARAKEVDNIYKEPNDI